MPRAGHHRFIQHAASAISRRQSLVTLAAATLAATFTGSSGAVAGKVGKRAKKKCEKRCQKQGPPCREFVDEFCERLFPSGIPLDLCLNQGLECCPLLEQCEGGAFFTCLEQRLPPP